MIQFSIYRILDYFLIIFIPIAKSTKSDEDMKTIVNMIEKLGDKIDNDQISAINSAISQNIGWIDGNLEEIELWLSEKLQTSTTPVTEEPTSTTTLGSSAVVSSTLLVLCGVFIKFLI